MLLLLILKELVFLKVANHVKRLLVDLILLLDFLDFFRSWLALVSVLQYPPDLLCVSGLCLVDLVLSTRNILLVLFVFAFLSIVLIL